MAPRQAIQINLRVPPDLREQLQRAAEARGVSVTREINDRLAASFGHEAAIDAAIGNRTLLGLLRLVGVAMQGAGKFAAFASAVASHDKRQEWIDNPYAYDQATRAALTILDALRPPGEIEVPRIPVAETVGEGPGGEAADLLNRRMGDSHARGVIYSVTTHPPAGVAKDEAPHLQVLIAGLVDRLRSYSKRVRS